jgi:hypothetical protein
LVTTGEAAGGVFESAVAFWSWLQLFIRGN